MGRVAGKVAIVTGAASGMGQADAILLAAQGATVVLADLNESAGQAVVKEIGKDAIFMRLDVSDEENWKQVIAETLERFGRLDILVNNAGIIALGSIVDTTLESWRLINSVNSDGVFLGCKHAIPASRLLRLIPPARARCVHLPRISPCIVKNRKTVFAVTRYTPMV
jgi:3(or 17)beta-hydroxysteroid dehydrogenase